LSFIQEIKSYLYSSGYHDILQTYDDSFLRKELKVPIIGVMYIITEGTVIKEHLKKSFPETHQEPMLLAYKYAKSVFLSNFISFAKRLKLAVGECPIWTFLDGFIVDNTYFRTFRLDTKVSHKRHLIKIKGNFDLFETSTRRMGTRCVANFIHSLDSKNLSLMVISFPGPVLPIHDCGIVKASETQLLLDCWTKVYRDIYHSEVSIFDFLEMKRIRIILEREFSKKKVVPPTFEQKFMFKVEYY